MTQMTRHFCNASVLPGGVPDRIEIMPVGAVRLADTRGTFALDDPAAVIARSLATAPGGVLPIDFDHRSFTSQDSRAAGWITELYVDGSRIMAKVEWTPDGRAALEARAWRFISPVFKNAPDRRIMLIEGAGLVNNPAIPELRQLASKETAMDLTQIAGLLGMSADQPDKIGERITALVATETQMASVLAAAQVAPGDQAVTQICAKLANPKLMLQQPDPAKFVPIAAVTELQTQLASLQVQVNGGKVDAALEAARASGRIAPGMEDWARQYASKDLAGFTAWAGAAPQIMVAGKMVTGTPPAADANVLTAEERQICAMTGVSEKDFLATRTLAKKEA